MIRAAPRSDDALTTAPLELQAGATGARRVHRLSRTPQRHGGCRPVACGVLILARASDSASSSPSRQRSRTGGLLEFPAAVFDQRQADVRAQGQAQRIGRSTGPFVDFRWKPQGERLVHGNISVSDWYLLYTTPHRDKAIRLLGFGEFVWVVELEASPPEAKATAEAHAPCRRAAGAGLSRRPDHGRVVRGAGYGRRSVGRSPAGSATALGWVPVPQAPVPASLPHGAAPPAPPALADRGDA